MAKVKEKNFIKRHKKLVIFLVIILLIGAFVLYMSGQVKKARELFTPSPEVTSLEKQDLRQIVTTTGATNSITVRNVNSSLSAEIVEVVAKVGDKVQEGDVLCRLDTTDLDKNIAEVKTSIQVIKDQEKLQMVQAERRLQDAINQKSIDEGKYVADTSSAKTAWDNAKIASQYDFLILEKDAAAIIFRQLAEDTLADPVFVETARIDYETKQNAVTVAEQALVPLENAYNQTLSLQDATLRADSLAIEGARDSINNLKLADNSKTLITQLDSYITQKSKAEITAPVKGTVTAASAQLGSMPSGGLGTGLTGTSASSGLFTIEDLNELEVKALVPEYDAVLLKVGLQVEVLSDAITNGEWSGIVKAISPVAIDANGNFEVVVRINSALGQLTRGMSTKIYIIVESKSNLFAVPYDAVVLNEQGQQVVFEYLGKADASVSAASGTQTASDRREIAVTTGIGTDYYIEITSEELKDGMQILNDPNNLNTSAGLVFDMGGGF